MRRPGTGQAVRRPVGRANAEDDGTKPLTLLLDRILYLVEPGMEVRLVVQVLVWLAAEICCSEVSNRVPYHGVADTWLAGGHPLMCPARHGRS